MQGPVKTAAAARTSVCLAYTFINYTHRDPELWRTVTNVDRKHHTEKFIVFLLVEFTWLVLGLVLETRCFEDTT